VNRTASRALELAQAFASGAVASGAVASGAVASGAAASAAGATTLDAGGLEAAGGSAAWDLVINATASGLSDAAPDLPSGIYAPSALAYDMVYGARPTAFMAQAAAQGARTADGLGMLVAQAAESFHIWRGILPDTAPVLAALRAELDATLGPAAGGR